MPGDGDARRNCECGAQALDVARHRRRGVDDGVLAQVRFVGTDPLGVAVAEGVVGERAGSTLSVVDHGDLEQRAVGQHVLGDLGDERDVVDHLMRDPPADIVHHDRITQLEAEEVRRVDPRIEAGDHEQAEVGEDDGALMSPGGREGAVARERGVDVGHPRLVGAGQFEAGRPAGRGVDGRVDDVLFAHGVWSRVVRGWLRRCCWC